ncbi:hypothetical protein UFOVP273_141 [uncultured Caudovirales phage]|uniref:Uncharacterized protein n=1 Tax=uncultured Caudovirales phage TaxID=2100421 RepID=A0A6J5LLW7_9CAUD|nr:hypothetical protein UFOVP273_141 [uncultured Caudovirales phage]
MPQLNLLRNSRVFLTANVDTNNIVQTSGFVAANTQELSVLDNFSFSQQTNADTVAIMEASSAPARGQRSFNTSLNPVEFSFSTYIRPNLNTTVKADESVLWAAFFSATQPNLTGTTLGGTITTATCSATTGQATVVGTSLSTYTVGKVYHLRGAVGARANELNSPVRVLSSSATTLIVQYLTAPTSTAFTTANITTAVSLSGSAWIEHPAVAADTTIGNTAYSEVTSAFSNINQFFGIGFVIVMDSVTYVIDNAALDQASIDFGLDGIATIAWSGKGTALRSLAQSTITGSVFSGALTGTFNGKSSVATTRYITNKLSTVSLAGQIGGGGTAYNIPLTGGSITFANNLNYLTPANLGVVNLPIGYYAGTRSITGSLNAYLRTGTNTTGQSNAAQLLADMLSAASTVVEPKYQLEVQVGGSSNPVRVELRGNGANLQIPTVDTQDIISTVINFTIEGADAVQGTSTAGYDLEAVNDVRIRYFSN